MKILVTGANGQLGKELHRVFDTEYPDMDVTYTDRDTLELTDTAAVERYITDGGFTHVVNCAAYTAVDLAEEEAGLCTAANVDAVKNLARLAEPTGLRILHISTDYVFDGNANTPYTEVAKTNPQSHYGSTKRKGETVLLGLAPDSIIIRTGWLYSLLTDRNFPGAILRKARAERQVKVVSDQTGTPTNARDLAETIARIIATKQWIPGIFHYSGEGTASWYDFAKAVVRLAGMKNVEVTPIRTSDYPTAATRPVYSVLDKSKIKSTFGIAIPHWVDSLEEAFNSISKDNIQ